MSANVSAVEFAAMSVKLKKLEQRLQEVESSSQSQLTQSLGTLSLPPDETTSAPSTPGSAWSFQEIGETEDIPMLNEDRASVTDRGVSNEELQRLPTSPFLTELKKVKTAIDCTADSYHCVVRDVKDNVSANVQKLVKRQLDCDEWSPVGAALTSLLGMNPDAEASSIAKKLKQVLDDWAKPVLDEMLTAGFYSCAVVSSNREYEHLCDVYQKFCEWNNIPVFMYSKLSVDERDLVQWLKGLITFKYSYHISDSRIRKWFIQFTPVVERLKGSNWPVSGIVNLVNNTSNGFYDWPFIMMIVRHLSYNYASAGGHTVLSADQIVKSVTTTNITTLSSRLIGPYITNASVAVLVCQSFVRQLSFYPSEKNDRYRLWQSLVTNFNPVFYVCFKKYGVPKYEESQHGVKFELESWFDDWKPKMQEIASLLEKNHLDIAAKVEKADQWNTFW